MKHYREKVFKKEIVKELGEPYKLVKVDFWLDIIRNVGEELQFEIINIKRNKDDIFKGSVWVWNLKDNHGVNPSIPFEIKGFDNLKIFLDDLAKYYEQWPNIKEAEQYYEEWKKR